MRFIETLRLTNLLSFGPDSEAIELGPLNVLIGPNGSGKSNLIEAVSLLRAAPRDLFEPVRTGGGIAEWIWKGRPGSVASIEATLRNPNGQVPLRHRIEFGIVGQRPELVDEAIENSKITRANEPDVLFFYRYQRGRPVLSIRTGNKQKKLLSEDVAHDQSILSQRKDPDQYPEVTFLGREYARIRLFSEWNLGRNTAPRRPQPADLPSDFLLEDGSNIALVLNDLEGRPGLRARLLEKLKDADGSIKDIYTKTQGGTVQLFLHYSDLASPVPATRLSDGTVRYLCLLALLLHPDPPPLICLEEPELGLHPDLQARLGELLIEASQRMQLIVTTHSDILVDALTHVPESVLVCEKHEGSTRMTRRTAAELAQWLETYGLGQLWRNGEIGGNRW